MELSNEELDLSKFTRNYSDVIKEGYVEYKNYSAFRIFNQLPDKTEMTGCRYYNGDTVLYITFDKPIYIRKSLRRSKSQGFPNATIG